jgi:hypothetical protein
MSERDTWADGAETVVINKGVKEYTAVFKTAYHTCDAAVLSSAGEGSLGQTSGLISRVVFRAGTHINYLD